MLEQIITPLPKLTASHLKKAAKSTQRNFRVNDITKLHMTVQKPFGFGGNYSCLN